MTAQPTPPLVEELDNDEYLREVYNKEVEQKANQAYNHVKQWFQQHPEEWPSHWTVTTNMTRRKP